MNQSEMKGKKMRQLIPALGFIFMAANALGAQPMFHVARDGEALVSIVVSDHAPPADRHAAAELARFLGEVTGSKFNVQHGRDDRRPILVGANALIEAGFEFDPDGLEFDGMDIRFEDGDLLLAGGGTRGALYAVFHFLQQYVGCRWWSAKTSHIPNVRNLSVPKLNRRHAPPFEYRYSFWTDAFDADWSVRNMSNGYEGLSAPKYGGHMTHGGVHTFFQLIPPGRYFEDHPEWFSLVNGERIHRNAQLCLTNESMREELIKNLRSEMRSRPNQNVFSVSPNDWYNNCQCEDCSAIDEREGSPSGSLLEFVNSVAEEIETDFPGISISTLAYQYTRAAPRSVVPRENVIIQLCSIECSFAVPLEHERNASFHDDIVAWSRITERLYVWNYGGNYRHHFIPHPNLRVMAPNIRFFANHNVIGVFEQGTYTSLGTEFAELRAWVLAQLMWDPSRDGDELIEEFVRGFYGPAADHILKYIEHIHDAADAAQEYANCLPPYSYDFPYLTYEVLHEALAIMDSALAAVADDDEVRERVSMARLPVLYSFMWKWSELRKQAAVSDKEWPVADDIRAVASEFKETATANGVTRVNEWDEGFGLVDQAVSRVLASNNENGEP